MTAPNVVDLKVSEIHANPLNPRKAIDEQQIDELAETIDRHGVLQPITVRRRKRGKGYELVIGERRWRACGKLALLTIPGSVIDVDDEACREIMLVENGRRVDLTALEEADTFAELRDKHGLTLSEIADKVGKPKSTVHQRLALEKLTKPVREALETGRVEVSVAELIARAVNPSDQKAALERVAGRRYRASYREAKREIEHRFVLRLGRAPWKLDDAELFPKAGPCTTCPKRSGNQAELFDADRKVRDLCLDESCFREKRARHRKALLDGAEAKGHAVLSKAETGKIFSQWGGLKHSAPYEQLTDKPDGQAWDKPRKTWKQILGKHLPPITIAIDPKTDEPVQLIKKADAKRVMKEQKIRIGPTRSRSGGGTSQAAQRRAVRLAGTVHDAVIGELVGQVESATDTHPSQLCVAIPVDALRILTEEVLESVWSDATNATRSRRGIDKGGQYSRGAGLTTIARNGQPREVLALALEALAQRHRPAMHRKSLSERLVKLAKAYGVDGRAIERRANAYVRKLEAAKAAKKKKPKRKARKAPARKKATPTKKATRRKAKAPRRKK